ncbi:hypothetical protein Indivirus_13_5 [Indivirus ILV1]|uniref:Endonuclease/exonuclease/phosphatase family protein n=1 Tax=Indivirus ILV1 TaxID=1977633 RepID=A0A1V0SEI1_9VIRU|nr:hypothetical protein Indivirus_13_5 [Indivirus ILV1]
MAEEAINEKTINDQFRRVELPWKDLIEKNVTSENYDLFITSLKSQRKFDKDVKNIGIKILTQNLHFRPETGKLTSVDEKVCTGESNFQNIQSRRACEFASSIERMDPDEKPDIICIQEATDDLSNETIFNRLSKSYTHVKQIDIFKNECSVAGGACAALTNPPGLSISFKPEYKLIYQDQLLFEGGFFAPSSKEAGIAGADIIGHKGAVMTLLQVPNNKVGELGGGKMNCILVINAHPSPYVEIKGAMSYFLKHASDFKSVYNVHKNQMNLIKTYIDAFLSYLGVRKGYYSEATVLNQYINNKDFEKIYSNIKCDQEKPGWTFWGTVVKLAVGKCSYTKKWVADPNNNMDFKNINLLGIFIAGDMNINRYAGIAEGPLEKDWETGAQCCSNEFYQMLHRLSADQPPIVPDTNEIRWVTYANETKMPPGRGGMFTWDGELNAITQDPLWPKSFSWIDFIFYYHGFGKFDVMFHNYDPVPLYMDNRAIRFKLAKKIPEISKYYTDCVIWRSVGRIKEIINSIQYITNLYIQYLSQDKAKDREKFTKDYILRKMPTLEIYLNPESQWTDDDDNVIIRELNNIFDGQKFSEVVINIDDSIKKIEEENERKRQQQQKCQPPPTFGQFVVNTAAQCALTAANVLLKLTADSHYRNIHTILKKLPELVKKNLQILNNKKNNEPFRSLGDYNIDTCTFVNTQYSTAKLMFGTIPGQNEANPYKMIDDISDHYGVMSYIILDTPQNRQMVTQISEDKPLPYARLPKYSARRYDKENSYDLFRYSKLWEKMRLLTKYYDFNFSEMNYYIQNRIAHLIKFNSVDNEFLKKLIKEIFNKEIVYASHNDFFEKIQDVKSSFVAAGRERTFNDGLIKLMNQIDPEFSNNFQRHAGLMIHQQQMKLILSGPDNDMALHQYYKKIKSMRHKMLRDFKFTKGGENQDISPIDFVTSGEMEVWLAKLFELFRTYILIDAEIPEDKTAYRKIPAYRILDFKIIPKDIIISVDALNDQNLCYKLICLRGKNTPIRSECYETKMTENMIKIDMNNVLQILNPVLDSKGKDGIYLIIRIYWIYDDKLFEKKKLQQPVTEVVIKFL